MGEGVPIVLSGERLLLIALAAFFRRAVFWTTETRGDLKRTGRPVQPVEQDGQSENRRNNQRTSGRCG
jgi:hypothetical protein